MKLFRADSISAKLTWLNLLVTGGALLLACLSFLGYDFYMFRANLMQNLLAAAQITGSNSVSALTFDDPQAAETTLAALKGSPDVMSAEIVDAKGHVFARYQRADAKAQMLSDTLGPKRRERYGPTAAKY